MLNDLLEVVEPRDPHEIADWDEIANTAFMTNGVLRDKVCDLSAALAE